MSSPRSTRHEDSNELTPRSKVKAMLAAIDDDSDSGNELRPQKDSNSSTSAMTVDHNGNSDHGSHKSGISDLSDDNIHQDEPHALPAPRGRVAARLNIHAGKDRTSSEGHTEGIEDAYSRLKKQLADRSSKVLSQEGSPKPAQVPSSTDEDDVIPSIPKRKRKVSPNALSGSQSPNTSQRTPQRSSPGLFLTPRKEQKPASPSSPADPNQSNSSESELPADPQANSRFLALVARKREERKAKAKAEAEKKAQKLAELREHMPSHSRGRADSLGVSENDSDVKGGEKLTQYARPTRKASKKALEEMDRETQRMSRNMQLAHQAKTKKKITKESLFARFNYHSGNPVRPDTAPTNGSSAAASSNFTSEAEAHAESPPTSPMAPGDETVLNKLQTGRERTKSAEIDEREQHRIEDEEELPDFQSIVSKPPKQRKEFMNQVSQSPKSSSVLPLGKESAKAKGKATLGKQIRIRPPKTLSGRISQDSGSDLEILPMIKPKRKVDVFDRLPAAKVSDERSLQRLRALAHLTSPGKRMSGAKSSMSLMEMQDSLQKRARQQAARERAEKIQELKDRGIIVQTAEERQKDQAEIEDLLEKARREAEELKQKEKDVAKKQARENGEAGIADASSDEDEDYQENDADESEIDLSGSEEEEENEPETNQVESNGEKADFEDTEGDANGQDGALIEDEASEASKEDNQEEESQNKQKSPDSEEQLPKQSYGRRKKHKVIDDDEDDEENERTYEEQNQGEASIPKNVQSFPNLGLPVFSNAPMGMTQAFAATMADSQTPAGSQHREADQEEDSLAFLGPPPEPEFPVFNMDDSPQVVPDSQQAGNSNTRSQDEICLEFTQSQIRETPVAESVSASTQLSEIPDPTQDVGFALTSPVAGRYAVPPPSTIETVILPRPEDTEQPVTKKRGRLRRKLNVAVGDDSDMSADLEQERANEKPSISAFDVLKKGIKKASDIQAKFDKKKSNAHEMVEEQAQESEDEYAGLGGASDDDSGGEEDEEMKKMIEQGDVEVDERQLAAFYANKERASDEKAVEKLFKDINNGMLRHKRGAEFDLSDSEDGLEARRRRKRREFAKMRKALLENENVGKIAEDPKKLAFLRAIEDREDDEDLDFLDQPEESSQPAVHIDSQSTADAGSQARPDPPVSMIGKRKRPLTESAPDATNRPPATARRTPAIAKPSSLAEIRASVSFLIEEPNTSTHVDPLSSSPTASDNENDENEIPASEKPDDNTNRSNPYSLSRRRTAANPVIDRLSLKRTSSTSTSASNKNSNLFFHPTTSTSTHPHGFRVPSLLRRATTSLLSGNSSGQDQHGISTLAETERAAGGGEKGEFVRKGGGGKRSSVNWCRREKGRIGVVGEGERDRVRRMVSREGSGLAGLGGGRFE
ncbi:MAG: hypothetical protein Q9219_004204 [cf. Caloplaca sp. 3 TL-2023]